jgi:hypothetical protein
MPPLLRKTCKESAELKSLFPQMTVLQPIVDIGIAGRGSDRVPLEYSALRLQMRMFLLKLNTLEYK